MLHSRIFEQYSKQYRNDRAPIPVNFRQLVPFHSGIDRYTHLIHPYPAKLLLNIPYFFLRCEQLFRRDDVVLDPFCGSGTVLLEALLRGGRGIGADANPLARLITEAKLTSIPHQKIKSAAIRLIERASSISAASAPDVVNISHWFSPTVVRQLSKIVAAVQAVRTPAHKRFFEVCLSSCIRKLSYADPRLSVPVRLNAKRAEQYGDGYERHLRWCRTLRSIDVLDYFTSAVDANLARLRRLDGRVGEGRHHLYSDARQVGGSGQRAALPSPTAHLIITSPPYVGAQKYIRSSSLSLGWLGLAPPETLRPLERLNIGREHYSKNEYQSRQQTPLDQAAAILEKIHDQNPLRAHIASNYLHEMKASLQSAYDALHSGGHMVLVVGANIVCGHKFDTPSFLELLSREAGFSTVIHLVDDIRSRGLMTKRNKTAGVIASESVLVMRKH